MGNSGSSTQSTIEIVNNSIIEAVLETAQNCGSNIQASQQLVYSGLGIFNTDIQTVNVNLTCLQKVKVDNQLLADMAQKIVQNVQASNGSLFGGPVDSSANQKIQNYLSTKITTKFIQDCVASASASQQVAYSGVQIGIFNKQTINILQKCMSDALNKNEVAQKIVTNADQAGSASSSSLFSLPSFSFGSWFTYILIFLLIIVAVWVYHGRNTEPVPSSHT